MKYKYETSTTGNYALLSKLAKQNRKEPTQAEDIMWQHLRAKHLGVRFRRQHPILDFIVDFVCLELQLVVEVDGGYHSSLHMQLSDEERTQMLAGQGFTVIRFSNEEVLYDTSSVINIIMEYINNLRADSIIAESVSVGQSPLLRRGRGEVSCRRL